ncbi:ribonuclease Y [Candidatus Wolfebacteria bacterium]|nr:ribonuclease Y [Candidatus Wolfebacteria bacterium]
MIYQNPLFWGILVVIAGIAGYFIRQLISVRGISSSEQKIRDQIDDAKSKAKELILNAQGRATDLLEEAKKEERESKAQLVRLEERILKKEELLEKQLLDFKSKENQIAQDFEKLKASKEEINVLKHKTLAELEKIAKLSAEEAKKFILNNVREVYQEDLAEAVGKLEKEKRDEIERRSLGIMTTALQRYARSHVSEITTTVFNLADEDLKGKIIGREGRNIRALERATGVELMIDETPDSITISSFDPFRRELAKLALEKLIKDGRIQPVKIEEKVEEARQELNKRIMEIGEAACSEVGIYDFPKEIIQLLGRLHFRTSYGQNVLLHTIEMAHISAMLAAELGANVEVAKRGAMIHDIGKAIDQDVEGSHVELGIRVLKKYGINEEIINAMRSHHEEYPYASSEAYIVTAADVLSAARPGARRGTLENYIKRLADLEKIAMNFEGVKSAYAVSGGREIRIFVVPEKIDDFRALQLARDVANRIKSELKYPGEIKVNVIREIRAVEYAR